MYKTSDIVEASYLVSSGYKIDKIELISFNKGEFVFSRIDQPVIDNYMLGKGTVEPVRFNTIIKQLVTAVRKKSQA